MNRLDAMTLTYRVLVLVLLGDIAAGIRRINVYRGTIEVAVSR